jgi:hypothetical protein
MSFRFLCCHPERSEIELQIPRYARDDSKEIMRRSGATKF